MIEINKNISLIISVFIAVPIGFIYGFKPNLLFDIQLQTIDEQNVFKAMMGMYLGFSLLWVVGVFKNHLWQIAIISNFIFMLGLAFGRTISIISDGIPSLIFVLGIFGEVVLGFYSYFIWKNNCNN